jgi:hypothetical protein
MNTVTIKAPLEMVRDFFLKPDIVLRLNPSWYVREIEAADKEGLYSLTLYDDRTDDIRKFILHVEVWEKTICYIMNSNMVEFFIDEISPNIIRLSVNGDIFRKEDLPYWLRGLKNYIHLEAKQRRNIKWLLDRFWLRMTPSQRRITIIIILAEGIGLIALIAVVIALKIMKYL